MFGAETPRLAVRRGPWCVLVLAFLTPLSSFASEGVLDPSFGSGGLVQQGLIGAEAFVVSASVLQPDGKIVLAGNSYRGGSRSIALVRVYPDGSIDTTFGMNGSTFGDFPASGSGANAISIQSDGKLIAAGDVYSSTTAGQDFALARFNPNGSLDSTFGNSGLVETDFSSSFDQAKAIVVQLDGKLVAAGYSEQSGNYVTALARYNPDGSLDAGFGNGGRVTAALGGQYSTAYAVAIQGDGKILTAGDSLNGGQSSYTVARFNPDGSPDSSFGSGGVVLISPGTEARAILVQPNGQIVVCGPAPTINGSNFTAVRLNTDGSLDQTFGAGGRASVPFPGASSIAEAEALQTDGSIVLSGRVMGAQTDFGIARLTPGGVADPSFGSNGAVVVSFSQSNSYAYSVLYQSDGSLVADGWSLQPSNEVGALARVTSLGAPDPTFGQAGTVLVNPTGSIAAISDRLAQQSDGKILSGGWFDNGYQTGPLLARFNTDGSLDTSFGSSGFVTSGFAGPSVFVSAVTLQIDGRILAAGRDGGALAVARYNPDGSADTTFGNSGEVTVSTGQGALASALTLQGNGKVIAAGVSGAYNTANFLLVRLNMDGSLDPTFGSNGLVTTDFCGQDDEAHSVSIQPDGKIVAAGFATCGSPLLASFALARYNPDGSLDTTFGTGGMVITPMPSASEISQALVQPDGRIVGAGSPGSSTADVIILARYYSNGNLDPTFGSGGIVTTALSSQGSSATGLVLQNDGRLIASGIANASRGPLPPSFALVRYNTDGSLDSSFGSGGMVRTVFPGGPSASTSSLLQADGRLVAGGVSQSGIPFGLALARYFVVCGLFAFSPPSLPIGTLGVPYHQAVTASVALPPITYAVFSGYPPPGLRLSSAGVISGTPTAPGTFRFMVRAVDARGCSSTQKYSVMINPPGPRP